MKTLALALQAAWLYFDGKKTAIGAFILGACFLSLQFKQGVLIDTWHVVVPFWFDASVQTAQWFGTVLSGVGIAHKFSKQNDV